MSGPETDWKKADWVDRCALIFIFLFVTVFMPGSIIALLWYGFTHPGGW